VRAFDPFDDAVEAQAAHVVGHPTAGDCSRVDAQQLRQRRAKLRARKPVGLEQEHDDDREESLDARIIEAERRCSLLLDDCGTDHTVPRVFGNGTVVTDSLDVEQTSVG
jgi:hypothetical protein